MIDSSAEYKTTITKAKQYILYDFLHKHRGASFTELERELKSHNFFKEMDSVKDEILVIGNTIAPNIVFWLTENRILYDAFVELIKAKEIVVAPTQPIVYFIDGAGLAIPVFTDMKQLKEKDKRFWQPVVIYLPHIYEGIKRHDAQEDKYNKKFVETIKDSNLVARHICMTGIGYYPKNKDDDELKDIFYNAHAKEPEHNENCEMPDLKEIELCKKFIKDKCMPTKDIIKERGSYTLKHVVERWTMKDNNGWYDYVSNGAFIVAAQELGYKMEEDDQPSPNAFFNLDYGVEKEDTPIGLGLRVK